MGQGQSTPGGGGKKVCCGVIVGDDRSDHMNHVYMVWIGIY